MSRSKAQPKTPNNHNIKAQITKLQEIKPKVLRRSAFGDNHHDAIDAQIKVLEKGTMGDKAGNYFGDDPQNVQDAARDAALWLAGQYQDYPDLVESWRELVR